MLLGCVVVLMLSGIVMAQTVAVAEQMQWFKGAKFGMFIHFQVPRNGEFDWSNLDTAEWVRIAKAGGMKYITLTTKHSSGIPLWESAISDRDITDRTSFKRDIIGELKAACMAEGLRMGSYFNIGGPSNPGSDITGFVDTLHGMMNELCEKHQPCLIWFDGGSGFRDPAHKPLLRRKELVDMLHSYGTLSNSRLGDDDAMRYVNYLTMNDNMAPAFNLGVQWETAVTITEDGSWHFTDNAELRSAQDLLHRLINAAGNGGNLLLNVGPDKYGIIPETMASRLKTMGDWLKKNGEAIYGTEPGPYRYEISWGSITQRKGKDSTRLYLNVVDWPKVGKLTLFGVNNPVLKASLLATGAAIKSESKFDVSSGQTLITLDIPKDAPDEYVSVIKLVVAGTVSMDPAFMQLNDGKVIMGTYNATIHDVEYVPGKPTKAIDMKMFTVPDRRAPLPSDYTGPWDYQMYKKPGEGIMPSRGITVSGFQTKGQALSWDFRVYKPGTYKVVVVCHVNKGQAWNVEGRVRAHVAGQSVENELIEDKRVVPHTMNEKILDLHAALGTVEINSAGAHTLTLEVASDFTGAIPRFRSVMLVPVTQDN